jgi:hypothetical protein
MCDDPVRCDRVPDVAEVHELEARCLEWLDYEKALPRLEESEAGTGWLHVVS